MLSCKFAIAMCIIVLYSSGDVLTNSDVVNDDFLTNNSTGEVDALLSTVTPSTKPSTLKPTKYRSTIFPTNYQSRKPSSPSTLAPSFRTSTKTPSFRPTSVPTVIPSSTYSFLSYSSDVEVFRIKSKNSTSDVGTSRKKASPTYSPVPSVKPTTFQPTTTRAPVKYAIDHPQYTFSPSMKSTCIPSPIPSFKVTVSPTPLSDDISYHGGLIMTGTVNAYNIYYGNISSSTKNLINYFATNLGNTSWYNTLTTYYQIVQGVKTYVSQSLVFQKSVDVTAIKTILTVKDVINIILDLFNSKKLLVDTNGVYTLFFRGDIQVKADATFPVLYWLQDFCGYHGGFYLADGRIIKFVVIGDPSHAGLNGEACEPEIRYSDRIMTANNNLGADSMASVYAHEMAESITNYNGDAWYFTSDANENGDACSFHYGDYTGNSNIVVGTKRFLVQQIWVPTKGCVMSL